MTDRKFVQAITPRKNTEDGRGTVVVRVQLLDKGRPAVGNMHRSVSVRDATVSEIIDAIERALFHD